MQFSGLRKEFEVNSDMQHWCVDVARWFHRHGVVWSGTPSELAAELSSAGVVDEQLRALDANRLVAELEANAEGLQAAGVDVSVQRARERVRSISLRANGRETPIGREEEQPARVDGNRELYVVPIVDAEHVEDVSATGNGAESTVSMLDMVTPIDHGSVAETQKDEAAAEDEVATVHFMPEEERSVLPIGIAVLIGLIALGIILGFAVAKKGAFASVAGRVEAAPTSAESDGGSSAAENLFTEELKESRSAPKEAVSATKALPKGRGGEKSATAPEVKRLMQEAATGRDAASQYELGMRYAQGRGVAADKVAAYAWLVVALSNGETRSEATLQALSPRLSVLEVQKIRLTLGEWYAQGRGVAKDLVAAHKWYSLAEVAGSAEGTVRKKRIEPEMTEGQVRQSEEQTSSWLSRH
jgi:hypothetical protein